MSNPVEKYYWFINRIPKSDNDGVDKGIAYTELNELWKKQRNLSGGIDLPKTSWSKYIKAIREKFNLHILYNRSLNRYYIDKYEYDKFVDDNDIYGWLMNTMSVAELIEENRGLHDRILLEDVPTAQDDPYTGENYLQIILQAMQKNNVMHMEYQGFWDSETHEFDFEPYWIKMSQQRWYVVGKNLEKNTIHSYGLDRIWNIHVYAGRTFEMPADHEGNAISGKDYFSGSFGILIDGKEVEHVVLRVDGNQQEYIRSLPFHPTQQIVREDDGTYTVEFDVRVTYDLMMRILSYAPYVIVRQPKHLADEISWRAKMLYERYFGRLDAHDGPEDNK